MHKKMKTPSLLQFNHILDSVSHEDNIGHLFVVDIKFHNRNPKTNLFNEIYAPIFEKKNRSDSRMIYYSTNKSCK